MKVYPLEMLGRCIHEAGHAAMFWYVGNTFHDDSELNLRTTPEKREIDFFQWPRVMSLERIKESHKSDDPVYRECVNKAVEDSILIALGGPLAEHRFKGRGCPVRAIRWEVKTPGSDAARIREYLLALKGKDDKPYQLSLQKRAWTVITETRIWDAIQKTAKKLLRRRHLLGSEINSIFEKSGAPQWYWCRDPLHWERWFDTPPLPPVETPPVARRQRLVCAPSSST